MALRNPPTLTSADLSPMQKEPRKVREFRRREQEILDTALKLFLEQGEDSVTVENFLLTAAKLTDLTGFFLHEGEVCRGQSGRVACPKPCLSERFTRCAGLSRLNGRWATPI